MKLKSVELIGFKSFAKRTKLKFPLGITEIVGPNGSGKSNIIEAIRWALGEQSAKTLRSSRMTDVIFSGSQSHPALNRAKVTLVFDNSDHFINVNYTEIKVARTVYRDGTNNYYLNGKPCRLRDIQELFMNTGIGNDSFSIISQGRVAQIFKSKPVDRRFVIETVAGISKYRSQKELASHRLSRVDSNLTLVRDLNYELGQRLHGLKQERHLARQYLKQQRLVNRLNVERLSIRFLQLSQKRRTIRSHSDHLASVVSQLKRRFSRLQAKSNQIHNRSNQFLKQYNHTQEIILGQARKLDQLSSQGALTQQKVTLWKKQIARYQAELVETQHRIKVVTNNQANLRRQENQTHRKEVQIKHALNQISSKRDSSSINHHRKIIERLRSQYVNDVKLITQIKGRINHLRQDHQQQKLQAAHLRLQQTNVQSLIDKVQRHLKINDKSIVHLKHLVERLTKKSSHLQAFYYQIYRKFMMIHKTYSTKRHQQRFIEVRLNSLKQINAHHSNLYNGTRNLLDHQSQFPGILGTVAKFIDVPTKYIRAIEATLRSQLQQIIVDDDQTARDAVRFMSSNQLGRVTLLPVNSIAKRWIEPAIITQCQRMRGFIDVAANLVKMPGRFLNVKLHLLGNVLIATDISSAIQISKVVHRRYRIVTLDGNIVNAGGAVTGGHGRYRYHGLLAQKAKIVQYQKALTNLNQKINQISDKGVSLDKRLKRFKKRLRDSQTQLNQQQQRFIVKKSLSQHLNHELYNYRTILSHHPIAPSHRYQEALRDLLANQVKVKADLAKDRHRLINEQNKMTHQNIVDNRYNDQYQAYREILIKVQDQIIQDARDFKTNQDRLKRSKQSLTRFHQVIVHYYRAVQNHSHRSKSNHDLDRLRKSMDQLNFKQDRLSHLSKHSQQLLTETESRLPKARGRLISLQNRINQSHFNGQNIGRKLHEVIEILFGKYQIDVMKEKLPRPKVGLYQVSSQLFKAQKHLQQIGPVNVNSIGRFKKVNHHYQFLNWQVSDLVTSKHQLMTTMNQMNSTIKIRFKKTFNLINQAFKITYSQIFKGGHARLTLVDPKHLLTTGVNIMAQPPGKRYRNMELLSGGERALTAIALLFAILKVKPTPFCILDEAESALDAVNIDRFGNYMQKLKAKTQFIVITHRKTTMLYADNLYGVTMQNSGISKIISVNLKKVKQRDEK